MFRRFGASFAAPAGMGVGIQQQAASFHQQKVAPKPPRSTNGPLFDSHCHIGLGFSYGPDKPVPTKETCPQWPFLDEKGQHACEEQFVRAIDSGVTRMALIGIDAVTTERVRLISQHLNTIALGDEACGSSSSEDSAAPPPPLHAFWTAGIHPHSAHLHGTQFPVIEGLVRGSFDPSAPTYHRMNKLVAIGETGMDFFKSKGALSEQRDSLLKHLELAYELDLPVIIHAREADPEIIACFEDFIAMKKKGDSSSASSSSSLSSDSPWRNGGIKGVMHCFSSGVEQMERYLAMGFFISFTNNITYKRSVGIQEACARCPADRIVIETDSPFLPPQRVRGGVNEPANTRDTFERACQLRGIYGNPAEMEAFQRQLWVNTHRLFNLPL